MENFTQTLRPEPRNHLAQWHHAKDRLTASELSVLEELAKGNVPARITLTTNRKVSTVRTHIRSIMSKLDAHSMVELLSKARSAGLFVL